MAYAGVSGKNRSLYFWINLGAASLLLGSLAGCGGGGGGGGSAAPVANPGVPIPSGAAPITLTATTPPATFAALTPVVTVGVPTIASPPKVTFSVTDGKGNAI